MQGLKDIKPLLDVPDITIYYFFVFIVVCFILLTLIAYILNKKYFNYKRKLSLSKKTIAIKRLKDLNFDDTKECVYEFTLLSYFVINSKETQQLQRYILKELEVYKYREKVPKLSFEIEEKMKLFIKKTS